MIYIFDIIKLNAIKDFQTFIDLIKNNTIKISILLRFSKSNISFGENKSKNIIFAINKYHVSSSYNKVKYFLYKTL